MNPEKDEKDTEELDGDLAIDDETAEQVTGGLRKPELRKPELRKL